MNKTPWPGKVIRDLRNQRQLTGEEVARKTGLSQSRISRIETGVIRSVHPADIEKILNILDASPIIRQQVMSSIQQPIANGSQRFTIRYHNDEPLKLEQASRSIRSLCISSIPALLQTPDFRQALLKNLGYAESERLENMRITIKRQDLIWESERRYQFILHEAALYSRPSDRKTQLVQLDRVERFIGLRNIKIGIIPLQSGFAATETCTFVLHDTRDVLLALADSDLISRESKTIEIYQKLYVMLCQSADYEDGARNLIHKAMSHFS